MKSNILGYPRIGNHRELKKACEQHWAGASSVADLIKTGASIRKKNWLLQQSIGIDLIPSNDFSFYDQVLDMSMTVGCIPERYQVLLTDKEHSEMDLYFAMARGIQTDTIDITPLEMTKWFDTNYHYLVPEFTKNQQFKLNSSKIVDEFQEALAIGIKTKPVVIGPISFLLLGKEKEAGFNSIELVESLLPVYFDILKQLEMAGAEYIQFDEPYLSMDLNAKEKMAFINAYKSIATQCPNLKIILTSYFDCYGENLETVLGLPIHTLHLDLVRCPSQLDDVLKSDQLSSSLHLSLGVVDGRNVWKNNFTKSLKLIKKATDQMGIDKVIIASSCSLLHSPCDLDLETNNVVLKYEIKEWLAFAKQKTKEVEALKKLVLTEEKSTMLEDNHGSHLGRNTSSIIHNQKVQQRVAELTKDHALREHPFSQRKEIQQKALGLPLFPTTTIGSFPQTKKVRNWRSSFKKGDLSKTEYEDLLAKETEEAIRFQEEIGLDVLVHGEFERNDMVEYFGEQLDGFSFTQKGWVQSYGSRCVKPPIIFGDVSRPKPMTLAWTKYAQSLTNKLVKGMLTGPVTILQWSFVRDDQPRNETCKQIALAIRDEVTDLQHAGIKVIQIDEPAIREGLPLRKSDWQHYLNWAIESFKIASSGVDDATQIHTHMCYSEFKDMIDSIAAMDADVITIECSRSQMELLDTFSSFKYPNEIGPGIYDIHSPRIPSRSEMTSLLKKAREYLPEDQLWVNPDCGLKTRNWMETRLALIEMVGAAQELRQNALQTA